MDAKTLYEKLKIAVESGQGHLKIVLPVSSEGSHFGPQPTVEVEDFSYGFDWNSGKIFLHPTTPVTEFKKDE